MKVYFRDGGRFLRTGGYPVFSQGILYGFLALGHEIYLPQSVYKQCYELFDLGLNNLKPYESEIDCDVAITITSINNIPPPVYGMHNVICTGSPYLGLMPNVSDQISKYDCVFSSGSVDAENFLKYKSFNLPQPLDTFSTPKNGVLSFVSEDISDRYSIELLFVGTFTYWKGVDQSIISYINARLPERSRLRLKCPLSLKGMSPENAELLRAKHYELYISMVLSYIKKANVEFTYSIFVKSEYVTQILLEQKGMAAKTIELDLQYANRGQMNQIYQSTDILLHLSRGETWSMPVAEALECGAQVIFPRHYGISEYVSDLPSAHVVSSKVMSFDKFEFSTDRASGGGSVYVGNGIMYFEVDTVEISKLIEKIANYEHKSSSLITKVIVQDRLGSINIARLYYNALFA